MVLFDEKMYTKMINRTTNSPFKNKRNDSKISTTEYNDEQFQI